MNFYGHAVVASWQGIEPAGPHALGAMLPDFAAMIRARLAEVRDPGIAAGVALHHLTDAAFHRLPGFTALCRQAEARLDGAGMRRGPARGAAHIAVEIFLDGVAVDDAAGRQAYGAALAAAALDQLGRTLAWRDAGAAARFERLRAHLEELGVPEARDPEVVAERVTRALAGRPLLALDGRDRAALDEALPALADAVRDVGHEVYAALRHALARATPRQA